MAAHNTFWISPEQKIDRLAKQLAEAQAEIAVLAVEADKSKARIAELEALLGEAPHSDLCDSMASGWVAGLEVAPGDLDCNCFKSRA